MVWTIFAQFLISLATVYYTNLLAFPKKNFETRLEIKKEAFLSALNILDAQASHYIKDKQIILQKVPMKEIRATFSKLLVFSDNPTIPEEFALFFYGPERNKNFDPINVLNDFRNLVRKELGLKKINFNKFTSVDASYFAYVSCAEEPTPPHTEKTL